MSTVFLVVAILVIIFLMIFLKNHTFVKCPQCGKWMMVKVSFTGEDVSEPGIAHFHEEGECKRCGEIYSRRYIEKITSY